MLDDAENFRSTEKSKDCVDEKCVWRPELRAIVFNKILSTSPPAMASFFLLAYFKTYFKA